MPVTDNAVTIRSGEEIDPVAVKRFLQGNIGDLHSDEKICAEGRCQETDLCGHHKQNTEMNGINSELHDHR